MEKSPGRKIIKVLYEEVPISRQELEQKLMLIFELIFEKIFNKDQHQNQEIPTPTYPDY